MRTGYLYAYVHNVKIRKFNTLSSEKQKLRVVGKQGSNLALSVSTSHFVYKYFHRIESLMVNETHESLLVKF